uniref:Uncharacterized protein n=1 Tax=Eutreptiella gymnastica TaxID=73025 RepID=A0A7S1J6K3_9EUGL|mmetsp:Transcript_71356/g.125629  ORF Transcript_71356/g.125629 Transcript_71356/m.125629 type:complete len:415 (+) Transcript_71356:161-1405(+)
MPQSRSSQPGSSSPGPVMQDDDELIPQRPSKAPAASQWNAAQPDPDGDLSMTTADVSHETLDISVIPMEERREEDDERAVRRIDEAKLDPYRDIWCEQLVYGTGYIGARRKQQRRQQLTSPAGGGFLDSILQRAAQASGEQVPDRFLPRTAAPEGESSRQAVTPTRQDSSSPAKLARLQAMPCQRIRAQPVQWPVIVDPPPLAKSKPGIRDDSRRRLYGVPPGAEGVVSHGQSPSPSPGPTPNSRTSTAWSKHTPLPPLSPSATSTSILSRKQQEDLIQRLYERGLDRRQRDDRRNEKEMKSALHPLRQKIVSSAEYEALLERLVELQLQQQRKVVLELTRKYTPPPVTKPLTREHQQEVITRLYEQGRYGAERRQEKLHRKYLAPDTTLKLPQDIIEASVERLYNHKYPTFDD